MTPDLNIPKGDISKIKALQEIEYSEFLKHLDKVDSYSLYNPFSFEYDSDFDENFSNNLNVADIMAILNRSIQTSSLYSMDVDKLIESLIYSSRRYDIQLDEVKLKPIMERAREKFYNSALAMAVVESGKNNLKSHSISENIRPVYGDNNEFLGYIFNFDLEIISELNGEVKTTNTSLDLTDMEIMIEDIEKSIERYKNLKNRYKNNGEKTFNLVGED